MKSFDMKFSSVIISVILPIFLLSLSVGIYIFNKSIDEKKMMLLHNAEVVASLISNVASFDKKYSKENEFKYNSLDATLQQVKDTFLKLKDNRMQFEYLVGEYTNHNIHFIAFSQHRPPSLIWEGRSEKDVATPMKKALNNKAGVSVELDYYGDKVFAAYTPIPNTSWALVIKQPFMFHIQEFINAAIIYIMSVLILLITVFAVFLRYKKSKDIKLQSTENKFQELFNIQKNIILVMDHGKLVEANKSFCDFFGVKNIEEFEVLYHDITYRFAENEKYIKAQEEMDRRDWIDVIINLVGEEKHVAMLDMYNKIHIFDVSATSYEEGVYVVSFTDISSTMQEKHNLFYKATHDNLTGIYNREYLYVKYNDLIENFELSIGLVLFDIDFFKNINDEFGHDVGDDILIELTNVVKSSIRKEDIFVRWGGEEFILVLSTQSLETLQKITEHTRAAIASHSFTKAGKVTCSFGVTLYQNEEDIHVAIKRADEALYKAKNGGRNRVVTLLRESED